MPFSATESDTMSVPLRTLAAREREASAPYDFAEFQRRAGVRPAGSPRGVERALRVAAMIAPLALLLTIAGVDRGIPVADETEAPVYAIDAPSADEPALVRVGPTVRVHDLEDRIALLDTLLSAGPVAGLSAEDRAQLHSGRDALAHSLQRVRYAQTLLAY